MAALIAERRLVVAVGYHLRGLEALPELRERLAERPARTVAGRWLDSTPAPAWWRRVDRGGGQVVEQATHLYDLGRHLVGEATVVGAVSVRDQPPVPADADVADATAAILRYETGAIGTFVNSRRSDTRSIGLELVGDGLRAVVGKAGDEPGDWAITIADGRSTRTLPAGRDPYEIQAERFLDAVEAGDPDRGPVQLRGRGSDRRADPGRGRGHGRARLRARAPRTSRSRSGIRREPQRIEDGLERRLVRRVPGRVRGDPLRILERGLLREVRRPDDQRA